MYKEIIEATINRLKEAPDLFSGGTGVMRGKFGKTSIAKNPSCVVLPDFGLPVNLETNGIEDADFNKKPELQVNLFLTGIAKASQEEAEDYLMDLAEQVHERMVGHRIEVTRGDHTEYKIWEFDSIEWIERAQTGCVLVLVYKMYIWV